MDIEISTIRDYYENINGQNLKLTINKYSNAIEIIIKNKHNLNTYKKCKLIFLIIVFNLIAFLIDVVSVNYLLVLLIVTTFSLYKILDVVKYESLLVVPQLGCQLQKKYVLGNTVNFIPNNLIDGIFINEVISKQRVLFVLSILIRETEKCSYVIPLFTGTNPRLKCIEVIYQNVMSNYK